MIQNAPESLGVVVRRRAPPDDIVAVVGDSENRVHDAFQVVNGGVVAVEIDAAAGLEDAVELQQSDAHKREVSRHAFAAGELRAVEQVEQRGEAALDFVYPFLFHVVERPHVLELRAARLAVERGGVSLVGVERRVEIDEVDAVGVYPAQNIQIVADEDGSARRVAGVWHLGKILWMG